MAVALAGLTAPAAYSRPFTPRDLAMLDRASDPHISPDGAWLVYTVRTTDWAANKGVNAIWLLGLADKAAVPRRLAISDKGASHPRWSPDGKFIYFLSPRAEDRAQVWRTTPAGEEAVQVTHLPVAVGSFRVAPDGSALILAAPLFPDCATVDCTKARLDARKADKASGTLYDVASVRFWDAWGDGRRNALLYAPIGPGGAASAPVPLLKGFDADAPSVPFGDDGDYTISPDGRWIVFAARTPGTKGPQGESAHLYRVAVDGSAPPALLFDGGPGSQSHPVYSPDGTRLAYLSEPRAGFGDVRAAVMVRDMKTGRAFEADRGFDRSAGKLAWSAAGDKLYAAFADVGQEPLFSMDVGPRRATPSVTPLTAAGHVGDIDVGPGGRIVFMRDALDSPAEIFALESGGARQLTHTDAAALKDVEFSAFEPFHFAGWNGETVHGFVVKPYGWRPGGKYPVAFIIHGGPHGDFSNTWSYRWNPQAWAALGYGVVMVDFHGSSGYGEAFAASVVEHWGDRPLEDLQKGWAAALAKYPWLDGDRACALGGSYGGYMIDWIAGVWNGPWKCLVDHDGVFDTRIMAYTTDITWFANRETGGTPWGEPANYARFNPIDHVGAWSKPILVIESGKDFRVPFEQGLGAYGAAVWKGVPTQFLTFPDENHWVLKPQNSVQWYGAVDAWMQRWLGS